MVPDSDSVLLLQFARAPVPGQVKTRMRPRLTPEQACELHRELVLWTCARLTGAGLGRVELAVTGNTGNGLFRQCRALGVSAVRPQSGADLGERMYRALQQGLRSFAKVVLVGSDCPELDKGYLEAALHALDEAPVVLGPATDGGYVLIGVRAVTRELFQGVPWGTGKVYAQTCARLAEQGLQWRALPALQDIDRPADLPLWHAIRTAGAL